MVMIKDNHISIASGVTNALKSVDEFLQQSNLQMPVEVVCMTHLITRTGKLFGNFNGVIICLFHLNGHVVLKFLTFFMSWLDTRSKVEHLGNA